VTLDVGYSKIKTSFGVKMTARAVDDSLKPLPGFQCKMRALTSRKGSVRLDLSFVGTESNRRMDSSGLQVILFRSSAQTPIADKMLEHGKTWLAGSGDSSLDPTGPGDNEDIEIIPEPMSGTTPVGQKIPPETKVPKQTSKPRITYFKAIRSIIKKGDHTYLKWRTSGASSVRISPGKSVAVRGRHKVAPKRTTTYTLYAQNRNGRASRRVKVIVIPRLKRLKTPFRKKRQ